MRCEVAHDERELVCWLEDVGARDVARVGGKNASLGEMLRALASAGVRTPSGFATTAEAFRSYVEANDIALRLNAQLKALDGATSLQEAGATIRRMFLDGEFPAATAEAVRQAYRELCRREGSAELAVAVRSSATAEDLPEASFAGQLETFLNIRGERAVLDACRRCYASLFTDRAISYRRAQRLDGLEIAVSVGVQKMVRADRAGAGVMFSIDTETGFPGVVVVSAAWGLGENVVQGAVDPDKYLVFKPLLADRARIPIVEKTLGSKERKMLYGEGGGSPTRNVKTTRRERNSFVLRDDEIVELARWATLVERHYERPMDMEWAKDGESGELFLVQARPETVHSRRASASLTSFRLKQKSRLLLTGAAIGQAIAAGEVCALRGAEELGRFRDGAVLVAETTDPDWVPIMRKAAGIVTDHGGATSHAAIVSRELGVPAVVGTGRGTEVLSDGQKVTLSCAEGDVGHVYEGLLPFETEELDLSDAPETRTAMMVNVASPAAAFRWWRLPAKGVGLARMEFIISHLIKVHPMALARFGELKDGAARRQIEQLVQGSSDKPAYFVDTLARGVAKIAAPFFPHPVIVRLSDFKSNEYAHLVGGAEFETREENPMLGLRGASRYYSDRYREGFALECRALKKVREEIGFTNVIVMVPFCRTPEEADRVLAVMAEHGLKRGENGLQVYVMCEIPSNVILADEFAERFDGFSIGSNDLTQLVLGVDRDSAELSALFDERNEAVKRMVQDVIRRAHAVGTKVGICGQAPSNYPDFAAFLVEQGIDSISLNPDSFVATTRRVAEVERSLTAERSVGLGCAP